jgi:hypothetical protein
MRPEAQSLLSEQALAVYAIWPALFELQAGIASGRMQPTAARPSTIDP